MVCHQTSALITHCGPPFPTAGGLHTSSPRSSGAVWTYRTAPVAPSKTVTRRAEFVSALMWWWVLYHLMTEYEHITGEFPYPDPSKWSDEELGIPPDDED
ncbi:NADH dehydrogenase [ubiquinone] 1 beta subcomplex subunit 2, mitochondrial-like [Scylla paramamosain]|uniref:NADH dehydrogenase [ubiquinone] 1 beta subcomplex subunit 2, mitochondrial-like n=1 Tax=Scylla paramamosain TaxID=85552 RepID=UPI003082D86E